MTNEKSFHYISDYLIKSNSCDWQAHERFGRLYDAYCKYLLSYATLPEEEKEKIEEMVLNDPEIQNSPQVMDCVAKVQ